MRYLTASYTLVWRCKAGHSMLTVVARVDRLFFLLSIAIDVAFSGVVISSTLRHAYTSKSGLRSQSDAHSKHDLLA